MYDDSDFISLLPIPMLQLIAAYLDTASNNALRNANRHTRSHINYIAPDELVVANGNEYDHQFVINLIGDDEQFKLNFLKTCFNAFDSRDNREFLLLRLHNHKVIKFVFNSNVSFKNNKVVDTYYTGAELVCIDLSNIESAYLAAHEIMEINNRRGDKSIILLICYQSTAKCEVEKDQVDYLINKYKQIVNRIDINPTADSAKSILEQAAKSIYKQYHAIEQSISTKSPNKSTGLYSKMLTQMMFYFNNRNNQLSNFSFVIRKK